MPAATVSPEIIRQWVHDRIYSLRIVIEERAEIRVPLPYWRGPDAAGCNWSMPQFGGDARAYAELISAIVRDAQERFSLPDTL